MSAQTSSSRPAADIGTRERIVVGIDDAAHGAGPMQWACQEAHRRMAALQVVSACPVEVGPQPTRPATYLGTDERAIARSDASRSEPSPTGAP